MTAGDSVAHSAHRRSCLLTRGDTVTSLVPPQDHTTRVLSPPVGRVVPTAMTDQSAEVRRAHYADLLSALGGTRRDPATARFDEELAAAEAAGSIDPFVARTLRWWQRESVRAVEDHLASVLPAVLVGLETADAEAAQAVADSAESWAAASGGASGRPLPPPPDDPGPFRAAPPGPTPVTPSSAGGSPQGPGDPTTPHLRPVDSAGPDIGEPPSTGTRLFRPGFVPSGPAQAPDPSSPIAGITSPGGPVAQDSPDRGAPPRRLLVAGLTVLPDDAPKEDS